MILLFSLSLISLKKRNLNFFLKFGRILSPLKIKISWIILNLILSLKDKAKILTVHKIALAPYNLKVVKRIHPKTVLFITFKNIWSLLCVKFSYLNLFWSNLALKQILLKKYSFISKVHKKHPESSFNKFMGCMNTKTHKVVLISLKAFEKANYNI